MSRRRIADARCVSAKRVGDPGTLRPMTEDDWGRLLAWNNDPEVMEHVESEGFTPAKYERDAVDLPLDFDPRVLLHHRAGRAGDRRVLVAAYEPATYGDRQFPDKELWRIDLMIGVEELWGRGYGSEAIRLLVEFGFEVVGADAIFGLVSANNTRSMRAFQKCGFTLPWRSA